MRSCYARGAAAHNVDGGSAATRSSAPAEAGCDAAAHNVDGSVC
jgi:hypothetical protein